MPRQNCCCLLGYSNFFPLHSTSVDAVASQAYNKADATSPLPLLPLQSHSSPAVYEEVDTVRKVKGSQKIELTPNEAYYCLSRNTTGVGQAQL